MDEQRARIHDDLRGLIEGELLFEPLERAPYAFDAGLREIDPLGVIAPRTEADLVTLVRFAAEQGLPLHARGAGTGLNGGCLGSGLVIDFSRHFRRVIEIRAESVVVQSGVVLDVLNAQLSPMGRRLAPDPEGSEAHTIGGMIGLDASGPRSLRYGSMSDHVERLRVVFANGEVADLGREPRPHESTDSGSFRESVVRRLGVLIDRNADLVASRGERCLRGRAGYALEGVASPEGLDLSKLIVGSEGTLALVSEATLRTVPIPIAQGVIVLPFARLLDAAEATLACLEARPAACELHDWRTLSLARDVDDALRAVIPESAEAALIVEFEGDDPVDVNHRLRALGDRLNRSGALTDEPSILTRRAEAERLLRLRQLVNPQLMRLRGPLRPLPLLDRLVVPPATLPEFLSRLQNQLKSQGVSWTLDARVGEGRVHVWPFVDLADPGDRVLLESLAERVRDTAIEFGGLASVGHGPSRLTTLQRQQGPLFPVHREVKYTFDPNNLLNPGRIVEDAPSTTSWPLKSMPPSTPDDPQAISLPVLDMSLRWVERDRAEQIAACNSCGVCRSQEPTLRMCPTFRASHAEAATPRAKINLLRQIASGFLDPRLWGTEEFKANADLCVHCDLCASECPAGIDVSSLMLEAKAAYVENHGLPPDDWMLSRIDVWSSWASRFPIAFNALMNSKTARWVLERALGLSRFRQLPRAHRGSFVRRAERLGLTRPRPREPGPRVAYFLDIFANHFDQELAETVVALLQHAGVNVYVPKAQRGCGMPALVAGDLQHARDLVLSNLRVLGNAVRDGYTVVCSEPTAALMLRREALRLTDDLDASLVAENTMDVGQYLAGLLARGHVSRPEQLIHARVGYHQPCHLRALGVGTPGLDLIRSIPGLEVEFIDRGCSGMAGTFGMTARHFRPSLRAGRGLFRRLGDDDLKLGSTECAACRLQMEQAIEKRTLHPLKLLALGYGLNPALRRHLTEPKPPRRIS